MQHKVLSNGRLLYNRDPIFLANFIEQTIKLYCDFQIDLNQFYRDYDIGLREEFGYDRTWQNHAALTREQANVYVDMARFRNRIVHLYDEIDPEVVYRLITQNLGDFRTFIAIISHRYLG